MPARLRNQSTSSASEASINVDEPIIVPDAQDLPQLTQEKMVADMAPSNFDSRPVDFELITTDTITMHESSISSDVITLLITSVFQFFNCKALTKLTLRTLLFSNQVPIPRARFSNRISLELRIKTLQDWFLNQYSSVNPSKTLMRLTQLFSKVQSQVPPTSYHQR